MFTTLMMLTVLAQTPAPAQRASRTAAPDALQLQVALDRAGFSPGTIDGRTGANTRKALEAFKAQGGDPAANTVPALTKYSITPEDAAGPFVDDIPSDLMEQSKLPAMGYRNVLELLSERFHSSPALLQRLNPSAKFAAGEEIEVPNVEPLIDPAASNPNAPAKAEAVAAKKAPAAAEKAAKPDVVVTVSKASSALSVKDADGRVVFYAPVTTGSEHDPLPIGEWKVTGVQVKPTFRYNPDLFWDADPTHSKAEIKPGPNNPVGLVWVDISKEHYGLHGTPEPATIGRTESHGCVRLTNWDAVKLGSLVKPGTRVVFTE
jgi:lipoprotein-anchoring transpeptidase ErfK/SrfK